MMTKWRDTTLGDIAEIVSGATPKTSVEQYWGGGLPWVTPTDLSRLEGVYIGSTTRTLTKAGFKSCASSLLPANSVLLSSRAPIGLVAINTIPMATNQGLKSLVPNHSQVDSKFLYWWLRCHRVQLETIGNGATFKEVSKRVVASVPVSIPPLEEQRRIAAVLDAAEALRAKRQQALKMLDSLAQAIFLDMFGNSVKNERGWPKYYLSDVATIDRRSLSPSEIRSDEQYVGLENITSRGAFEGVDIADKANLKSNKFIFNADHILYGKLRPYLTKIAAPQFEGICSTDILPVKPGSNLNRHYLLYYLRSPGIVKYATNNAVGINLPRLSPKVLESFEIPLPPIKEQEKFSFALKALTDLMDLMNINVDGLDTLFASLQQRAFRGEL